MLTTVPTQQLSLKAKLFNGFADPSRLAILQSLVDGPQSVGDIVEATSLSQPNTSNHLSCLLDCGLVTREKRGRYAYYQLGDERIAALLTLADKVLLESARGVYECLNYQVPESGVTR